MSTTPINLDLSQEIQTFLRLLKHRKLSVIAVTIVIFLIVAVGTFLQKPVYRATAAITIDMETPSLLAIYTSRDDATMAQSNYLTYADYYRTQLEILKSRRIAEQVLKNLNLLKKPRYAKAQDPVRELMKQISIEPVKQTRLVNLRVNDTNPKKAEMIANEAARVFVNENLRRTTRSETLNLMKNEYLSLQSKEAELSKRYKPKFPARLRVRNQMDQLAVAIERENAMRDDRTDLPAMPQGTAPAVAQSTQATSSSPAAGTVSAQSLRPNNIWIQTPAHVPHKPIKPNKMLNLLLGLLFGLVGGIAVAAFEEFLDATIKSSKDITDAYSFPFLGHVPHMPETPDKPLDPKYRYQHMHLEEGYSEIAEAYRVIRTNLLCIPAEVQKTAILITSPGGSEGKTTTACNLSMALAQTGLSVLLVDADLRKPNVHKALELPQTPGLSEFLTGRASFEELVRNSPVKGLSVITSGAIPKKPSELLGSLKMKEFHQMASERYDYVMIDTAPMIPVTDATILASLTHKIITVAQSGKTPREAFKRMMSICEGLNVKIMGVILNKVPQVDLTGYGYGHQIYAYGKPNERPRHDRNSLSGILERLVIKAKRRYAEYQKKRQG